MSSSSSSSTSVLSPQHLLELSESALNSLKYFDCLKKYRRILSDPKQLQKLPELAFRELPQLERGLFGNLGFTLSNVANPRPHTVPGEAVPVTRGVFCFGVFENPGDVFNFSKYLTIRISDDAPGTSKDKKSAEPEYLSFPECNWIPSRDLISRNACALEPHHKPFWLDFVLDKESKCIKERYVDMMLMLGVTDPSTLTAAAYDPHKQTPVLFFFKNKDKPSEPILVLHLLNHRLEDDQGEEGILLDTLYRCCHPDCDGKLLLSPPGVGPLHKQKSNRPRPPKSAFNEKFRLFDAFLDVSPSTRTSYHDSLIRCAHCRGVFFCAAHANYMFTHQRLKVKFSERENGQCLRYFYGSKGQAPTYPCYIMDQPAGFAHLEAARLSEVDSSSPIHRLVDRPWANPALEMFRMNEIEIMCSRLLNMTMEDIINLRFAAMYDHVLDKERRNESLRLQEELHANGKKIQHELDVLATQGGKPEDMKKLQEMRDKNNRIKNIKQLSLTRDVPVCREVVENVSRCTGKMFSPISQTSSSSSSSSSSAPLDEDRDLGPQAKEYVREMHDLDLQFNRMNISVASTSDSPAPKAQVAPAAHKRARKKAKGSKSFF